MLTLKSKLTYVNQSLQEIKAKERIIPDLKLDSLIKQAKKLEELKSLNNRLVINKDEQEKIDFLNSKIKIPKVDFDTLKEDNLMLTELIKVRNHLIENKKGQENITQQTIKQSNLLDNLEKELKEIWKKCKNCPLCKQEIQNG
jgi:predicted nucleotidyltransferase